MRRLFDQYAARYDAALTEHLAYRGPALLRDAVEAVMRAAGRPLRFGAMLDLGCGTGLAGAAFRPLADWLVGVDLSPAMIAQGADERPLRPARHRRPRRFSRRRSGRRREISISSLPPMSSSMSTILRRSSPPSRASSRPDGLFAFTVETHAGRRREAVADAALRPRRGLSARGARATPVCRSAHLAEASVRSEKGVPVDSLVVVARGLDREPNAPASSRRVTVLERASAPAGPFARWFASRGWTPRAHQLELLAKAQAGRSVLLIAPTGGGKTLAGFLPSLVELSGRWPLPARARRRSAEQRLALHRPRPAARGRPAHALHLAAEGARRRYRAQSGSAGRRDGVCRSASRRAPATRRPPSASASAAIRRRSC